MEESGSENLDVELEKRKDTFLKVIFIPRYFVYSLTFGTKYSMNENKWKLKQDVDYVCISDNYWLGKNKPCITYGLRYHFISTTWLLFHLESNEWINQRGICYFFIEIESSTKDLHSGVFGGSV